MGYFDKNSSGKLKTIMTDRIEDVEKTLAHLLPEMTANLIIPAAMIIWLSIINIKLTGIIMLWIIIGLGNGMETIKNSDHIIVLDKGKIMQEGTHSQLINQKKIYKNFILTKKEVVDFANPYMKVALGVVSKDDSVITDLEQLKLII